MVTGLLNANEVETGFLLLGAKLGVLFNVNRTTFVVVGFRALVYVRGGNIVCTSMYVYMYCMYA